MSGEKNYNELPKWIIVLRWMFIFMIIFFLSIWVDIILSFLLTNIENFQIFVSLDTSSYLQFFSILLLSIIIIVVLLIITFPLFLLSKIASKKHGKKEVFLSFYITVLLLIPFLFILPQHVTVQLIGFQIETNTLFIASILLYSIFVLLKLCLKHPVLDILLLIWWIIITERIIIEQLVKVYDPKIVILIVLISLILLSLFLLIVIFKKEIKEIKELIEKPLKLDPFDIPYVILVNRIYLLTILTITLFTLGTIFISGFTHVEDYKQLNITNAPSLNCLNSTTCNNNISDICNIYSKNSINAVNETLTVKSDSGYNYTLTLSSLCKQYDQDRKDFVTYFSTLIGAVIAFFITMYSKFIRPKERNKEETKNDKEQE